jgi:hypothetical protein
MDTARRTPWWLLAVLVLFALYFPAALWLQHSYVNDSPKGRTVVRLSKPFERFGAGAVAHRWMPVAEQLDGADSADDLERSSVLLYEGAKLLGPPHSLHSDIATLGHGRYSHWQGQGIVFSASDNSDPNSNGRPYWAVVPLKPRKEPH